MAAQVSALLESAELAAAERLPPALDHRPLAALDLDARRLWSETPRGPHAIRLDPVWSRGWVEGRSLTTHRSVPVPWDLLSLDYTGRSGPDALASSSGLATGNTVAEAAASAVAELLERDLTAMFDEATRRERRSCEIDADSVGDLLIRPLLARIGRAGFAARLWSLGDATGIASVRCALVALEANPALPPTVGSGCHPSRRIATLRAVLEAVQVHATLVAGARDDLTPEDYADPVDRRRDLLLETLSFARADRPWSSIPDAPVPLGTQGRWAIDRVLESVARRTSLPVIGLEHPSFVAGLTVFRALAPGLADPTRAPFASVSRLQLPPALASRGASRGRPVVFVGPSLAPGDVPPDIEARPPAVAGDLAALLIDPPPAVGLIDGHFETGPTVWHKEILHLLSAGVPVLGAASLGALRAAELDESGMTGIGLVYAAYRDGLIVRDDAVMLSHAPPELGCRPLGVSLVDMEAALAAVDMPATARRRLQRIARRLHHAERSWAQLLARFEEAAGRPAPVGTATLAACPSVKRVDALALIAALPTVSRRHPRFPPPPLTSVYARLLARVMPAPR